MRVYTPSWDPRHAIRIRNAIVQEGFTVDFGNEMGVNVDFAVGHYRE